MLKSNFAEKMKNKQDQNKISPAEIEKKKAARTDAVLSVLIDAITSIIKTNPAQAAASISYYSLISIFPLILFMVVVLSYFLEITVIQKEIILILENILPGSETLVIENMQNILSSRLTTSLTASITLLWSGSGALNCVIANVHMAWPESSGRGFFINRFFAISAIILICFVLAGTIIFSMVFDISDALAIFDIRVSAIIRVLVKVISSTLPLVLVYFAAYLLYYFVPTVKVDKQGARIGALVTSISWRIFTYIFGIYVLSPFNSYDVIYGSVAVIILLLLYVYVTAFIILFSAHLVAAITHYKAKQAERAGKAAVSSLLMEAAAGDFSLLQEPSINLSSPEPQHPEEPTPPAEQKKSALNLRKFNRNFRISFDQTVLRQRTDSEAAESPQNENKDGQDKNLFVTVKSVASNVIRSLFRWK